MISNFDDSTTTLGVFSSGWLNYHQARVNCNEAESILSDFSIDECLENISIRCPSTFFSKGSLNNHQALVNYDGEDVVAESKSILSDISTCESLDDISIHSNGVSGDDISIQLAALGETSSCCYENDKKTELNTMATGNETRLGSEAEPEPEPEPQSQYALEARLHIACNISSAQKYMDSLRMSNIVACGSALPEAKLIHQDQKRGTTPFHKDKVTSHDKIIICERGGKSNNNPGNKAYLKIITSKKKVYRADSAVGYTFQQSRVRKTQFIQETLKEFYNDGFIFVGVAQDEWYYEVCDSRVRRKISQAYREKRDHA